MLERVIGCYKKPETGTETATDTLIVIVES